MHMVKDTIFLCRERSILEVSGSESKKFLQSLITNELGIEDDSIIYSALLNPQGKYLFDFFIVRRSSNLFLIDIDNQASKRLFERLTLYKLRADVNIVETKAVICLGFSQKPKDAFYDPRCKEMGWRHYLTSQNNNIGFSEFDKNIYDKLRVELCIPETNLELIPDKTYILEAGFERLSGVSFSKGCYVGQEVTARMRHKTELQKGLVKVKINGVTSGPNSEIMFNTKVVGTLHTRVGDYAIAHLKFKYEHLSLRCGEAILEQVIRF